MEDVEAVQERVDGSQHGVIIELGVAVPDAVGHETAGSLKETRPLEKLVLGRHRPGPCDFFPVERVRYRCKRANHIRFYQSSSFATRPRRAPYIVADNEHSQAADKRICGKLHSRSR